MLDDQQLLERYVRDHAEDAFTELVNRHVGLVYSAALRQVNGNIALAEDVTQGVFVELARQAGKLRRHPALMGWLYTATRRLSLFTLRGEARRSRRERIATVMDDLSRETEVSPDWGVIGPVLDEAMHALDEKDREAILLRYFARHDFRAMGESLGLSDNGARMRVERALDRLREFLARRGVTSTASTLTAALATHAVSNPPPALAPGIVAAALAAPTAGVSLLAGLGPLSTPGKLLGVAAVLAAMLVGWRQQVEIGTLRAERQQLEASRPLHTGRAIARPALATPGSRPPSVPDTDRRELLQLRGEVARLRRAAAKSPGGTNPPGWGITPEALAFIESSTRRHAAAVDWVTILGFHETRFGGRPAGSLEAALRTWFANARPDPDSDNFAVRQAALDGSWQPRHPETSRGLAADYFELVYKDSLRAVAAPAKTIVLRERAPRWDGDAWTRTYCFADYRCVDHREASGDFTAWEREQRPPPSEP